MFLHLVRPVDHNKFPFLLDLSFRPQGSWHLSTTDKIKEDTFQKLRQNVDQNDSKSRRQKCLGCICYPITRILKTLYKHNHHCISTFTEHTQQGSFKIRQIRKAWFVQSNTSARSWMEKFCFDNSGLILSLSYLSSHTHPVPVIQLLIKQAPLFP